METACDILFGYRGYIYIKRYFKITSIRFLVTFVWLTSPCEYFFFFSCLLMTKICILMAVDEIIVNLLKLIVFIFKNLLRYYTNIINSSILEIERERKVKFADIYIYSYFPLNDINQILGKFSLWEKLEVKVHPFHLDFTL